jgi:hypothetical protein
VGSAASEQATDCGGSQDGPWSTPTAPSKLRPVPGPTGALPIPRTQGVTVVGMFSDRFFDRTVAAHRLGDHPVRRVSAVCWRAITVAAIGALYAGCSPSAHQDSAGAAYRTPDRASPPPRSSTEAEAVTQGMDLPERSSTEAGAVTQGMDLPARSSTEAAATTQSPNLPERACAKPKSWIVEGKDTGFVRCARGWFHRVRETEAPALVPRANATCRQHESLGDRRYCQEDTDCRKGKYGRCVAGSPPLRGPIPCHCDYGGCRRDAECGRGEICAPPGLGLGRELVGMCMPASCSTDADCGGWLCASAGFGFACRRPDDECDSDYDCMPPEHRHLWTPSVGTGKRCHIIKERRVCGRRPVN